MNILFDLDGTLTDPRVGIVRSVQYALAKLDVVAPPESELLRFIGPPLKDCFRELLATQSPGDESKIDEAIRFYRERYATIGLFENEVYAGIPGAMAGLVERGDALYVATSKPGEFSRRILEHFGLAQFFRAIWGSELDGTRANKADLIAYILPQENLAPSETLMVGDRSHDAVGALANRIVPIGVLWGYGSEAELRTAKCARILHSPAELSELTL